MHHILQERVRSALRLLAVRQIDATQRTRRLLPLPWRNSKIFKRMWAHLCAALCNGGDISARDQLKDGFDLGTASDVNGRVHVQLKQARPAPTPPGRQWISPNDLHPEC